MDRRLVFASLVAGICCITASSVRAVPVFENPPNPAAVSGFTSSGTQILADNFILAETTTIRDIHWWGFNASENDDFLFTFYEDAGSVPGNAIHTTGGSLMAIVDGYQPNPPTNPIDIYWSVLDAPFEVTGGVEHWLSIYNAGAEFAIWQSVGDNVSAFANPGTLEWKGQDRGIAFQLTNDAGVIPEPLTTSLCLLGFGALAIRLRRAV